MSEVQRRGVKRHRRVRKRVNGTTERPRLAVFRSNRHIYAQVIDDTTGRTVASASTAEAELRSGSTATVDAAKAVGQLVGERAKAAGISRVVFDRGGFRYHGRVAALVRRRPRGRTRGLDEWQVKEEAEAGSDGSRRPTASTRSGSSRSAGWPRSSRAAGGSRSRPWWSSGDGAGKVGLGLGKAKEVPAAIQKGIEEAKKNLIPVPLAGSTITHQIIGEHGAGRVLLKPAAPGTGVIAGGAGRAILEAAGVHDVLAKSLGSSNPINVARSVINGLQSLKRPEDIARLRGKSAEEVTPGGMLRAYNERNRPTRPVVEVQ